MDIKAELNLLLNLLRDLLPAGLHVDIKASMSRDADLAPDLLSQHKVTAHQCCCDLVAVVVPAVVVAAVVVISLPKLGRATRADPRPTDAARFLVADGPACPAGEFGGSADWRVWEVDAGGGAAAAAGSHLLPTYFSKTYTAPAAVR